MKTWAGGEPMGGGGRASTRFGVTSWAGTRLKTKKFKIQVIPFQTDWEEGKRGGGQKRGRKKFCSFRKFDGVTGAQ